MRRAITCIAVLLMSGATHAQRTETETMSFEECLSRIQNLATATGVAPINIVETNILRVVRFPTADGSVLVSCSKPDRKMVVRTSPKQ